MADKLYLAVCESYECEFRAAITAEKLPDVEIVTFPSLCAKGRMDRKGWAEFLNFKDFHKDNLVLISGKACNALTHLPDHLQEVRVVTGENCFYHLLGKSIVDRLINRGAYLVTSGWLMNWQQYIACWGFEADHLKQFFRDFAKRIIVLDTGINERCQKQAYEFSKQAGIPYKIFSVDPMYIQLFVKNIVLEWRLQGKFQCGIKRDMLDEARPSAEYAMMFDIISKLSDVLTEEEMVKKLLDTFMILFRPGKIGYHCISRNVNAPMISKKNASILQSCVENPIQRYVYTTTGTGFLLRIEFKNEVYGIVEIDELAFPEYRDRYLSLMLNVSKVCGLAISNARKYEIVRESIDQLQYINIHDKLTGIYNRFYFESQLKTMAENENLQSLGIFVCDVDGLKVVNDCMGHMAGDQLIILAAHILKKCFREDDVVARIGGDEFSVLIPNCTNEIAFTLKERVQQSIARYNRKRMEYNHEEPELSLSVGFAVSSKPLLNIKTLFHQADTKMYDEKSEKKGKKS